MIEDVGKNLLKKFNSNHYTQNMSLLTLEFKHLTKIQNFRSILPL